MNPKLLPYNELVCDNCNQISQDIWNFLNSHTEIIHKTSVGQSFSWNFFSPKDLILQVPSLNNWFKNLNLKLRDVAATVITDQNGLSPHKDEPPVIAKINFPVINTNDTWNIWWDDDGNEIARVQMFKPLAFNASMMHGVEMGKNCKYPRVVLSCMFIKQPLHLLVP